MDDDQIQELLCRWAEDAYGLYEVTSVEFDASYVEGCPTCGGESFIEVSIRHSKGSCYEKIYYGTRLIRDILKFSLCLSTPE